MNGTARRIIQIGWKIALVAVLAGFIIYRARFAPLPVNSHVAEPGTIVSEVMGTGTLEARVQATISPRISGLITQVLADQGDRISGGQLLVTLYDRDLHQQVEMAKADLAATKASVDRAEADIASAEATAVQARASHERGSKLFSQRVSSKEEFDSLTERRDVAEANLRRSQLAKIEIERQVMKAEETLLYYQERLADTKINSPFDALVIRRSRESGDIVVPGSEVLSIISTSQMWVSAWVDETAISALAVGQPVRVVFRSEPGKSYTGAVTRLAPFADRETREFKVDVTVKELPQTWAVGQRAEVYIQTASKDSALLVPQQAIVWQKGKPGLFASKAGRAVWRNVTIGLRGAEAVEVAGGLAAGETVIWLRDMKDGPLKDGRAIEPVRTP